MMQLPQQATDALNTLESGGYEAWLVGGCVRDAAMGMAAHDFDMATTARPDEVLGAFRGCRVIETGLQHGTVTVLMGGMPLEITTCRTADGGFSQSIEEDLSLRDFTINAMAYHPQRGLLDPFGGMADLEKGVIRCVRNADERFLEDTLRMLRAARFASTLGFAIEPETQAAIQRHGALLASVSAERVATEFVKLLCGKNARRVILEEIDLIGVFIPEALPMRRFDQHNHHHIYDVLTHTAVAVENVPAEPVLRLAAFLHDIGKPPCYFLGEDGEGHFYGHAAKSTEMAGAILARLKLDNHTRETVERLVKYHDHVIEPTPRAVKRMLGKLGTEGFAQLIALKRADNLAQHPDYRGRQKELDELLSIRDEVIAGQQCFSMKDLAINGRDLIRLGMKPGPQMGAALNALLEAVIEERVENTKEALEAYWRKG